MKTARRPRWWVPPCCVLLVVTAACGNRLSKQEILQQDVTRGEHAVAAGSQGGQQGGGGGSAGVSGAGEQSGAGSTASGADQSGDAGSVGGQSAAQSGSAVGGTSGAKAPIIVGFVGWLSGIGGPTAAPVRDAWVAWQKMVNARGGIKGHMVQLLIADDGGDESRTVALVRDFVENRGAIAISLFSAVKAVGSYAKSKSVPIIGSGVYDPEWNQNPMLFPPYPNIDGAEWGPARLTKSAGINKVATAYCVESVGCKGYNDAFVAHAKAVGLQVVYQGQISLTQPDYTAECLQMRNAGAEAVRAIGESTALVRMSQSCGRQGYTPTWVMTSADDSMRKIPTLEGAIASLPVFPWFLRSGSPGLDEYVQALQQYAPNRMADEGSMSQSVGWLAAKLLEKAAAKVSDRPTSQDILNGLWALKGETLGGLASGALARTFTQGQPTRETYCGFGARMQAGKWVAAQGLTPVCR